MKPIPPDPAAHHGDKSLASLICEKYPTRHNYGWRYQNGVKPGEAKLEQFKEVLRLRNTPRLGSQDGLGKAALVMVKLFNPCGSHSWFITEWDGDDQVFCFVTGMTADEWGYSSLTEFAFLKGKYGIGIEIEMTEPVKPLRDYLPADDDDADDEKPAEAEPTNPIVRVTQPDGSYFNTPKTEQPAAEERPSILNRPPPGGWRPEDRVPDHMRKPTSNVLPCVHAGSSIQPDAPVPETRNKPMFKSLTQLLDGETVLQLTVSLVSADTLSVVVVPKNLGTDAKSKAVLQQPLHLTATADELDAGFAEAVKSFQTGRMSLAEQVKSALAAAEAATAMTKAEGQRPKPAATAKPPAPGKGKPIPMPAAVAAPKPTPPAAPKATAPAPAPVAATPTLPKPPMGLLKRPAFIPGQLRQPVAAAEPAPQAEPQAAAAVPAGVVPLFEGHEG